jgi:hypothetical protein
VIAIAEGLLATWVAYDECKCDKVVYVCQSYIAVPFHAALLLACRPTAPAAIGAAHGMTPPSCPVFLLLLMGRPQAQILCSTQQPQPWLQANPHVPETASKRSGLTQFR